MSGLEVVFMALRGQTNHIKQSRSNDIKKNMMLAGIDVVVSVLYVGWLLPQTNRQNTSNMSSQREGSS